MKTANKIVKSQIINALETPVIRASSGIQSIQNLRLKRPQLLTLAVATALTLGMSADAFAKCGDFTFIAGDVTVLVGGSRPQAQQTITG